MSNSSNSPSLAFGETLQRYQVDLSPTDVVTLQLNITRLCNQACFHCHVDASPRRKEGMSRAVLEKILQVVAATPSITQIDITGGAPELHPDFIWVVRQLREIDRHVIVRHNLTVTMDPHPLSQMDMSYLPEFFAAHQLEVVSSLPCYSEELTNKQRGDGVFKKSIASLQELNKQGYGKEDSHLRLNLVYNPNGAKLPPPQKDLEKEYKAVLWDNFGIEFHQLFAITNMPINRFKFQLIREKAYESYMDYLGEAFNVEAAKGVMCRSLVSVGYDGTLYDCDFNQMLKMPILQNSKPLSIFDWDSEFLKRRSIRIANHCFGCTAGTGSSCGGSTTAS